MVKSSHNGALKINWFPVLCQGIAGYAGGSCLDRDISAKGRKSGFYVPMKR